MMEQQAVMRDIMGRRALLSGKNTFVFGGDFRQSASNCTEKNKATSPQCHSQHAAVTLPVNRSKPSCYGQPQLTHALLKVGLTERHIDYDSGYVRLPDEICVPCTGKDSDH